VEYLCDRGVLLEHNGARLWMAGANDPARGIDGPAAFLESTVKRAMAACPDDVTCRVLLAHRPRAFVTAAALDVTLTLSGHTHGAQMALFGRSLLEPLWPESFLLGHYRRAAPSGTSHLYTSAGLGHWMPFRLNCPCEAVLVTLRHAAATAVS
jgi:predicted MPP superfamily phosphohydrolase